MDKTFTKSQDIASRVADAKQFLTENPTESKAVASRVYGLNVKTLISSMRRGSGGGKRGGHNKILEAHQVRAVDHFIRSLLAHGIQPTHEVVFNAILSLKRAHNPTDKGPTKRWFRRWWQSNGFHKIKTKPLAIVRFSAAQEPDVKNWFRDYVVALKTLNVRKRRNIINFDEAGFRLGCMKGHEIIVPLDIKQHYAVSPENRKSLTVFEMVNAAGEYPPPPMVVIQGQELMASWFLGERPTGIRILTTDSGFTTNQVGIEFLKHYIENSDAGPDADWKLLLMDNHESHCTPEFVTLANENHIRPYPFIPHLTHCMQPLDVGIFQAYKHWHDVAIQEAIAESFIEYAIPQFLKDLIEIRNRTFKPSTIRHAFQKSGMWPVNAKSCIKQLKTYNPDSSEQIKPSENDNLPLLPRRILPQTPADVEYALVEEWGPKIQQNMQWSDPIRADEFGSFITNTKEVVSNSILQERELHMWHARRNHELQAKKFNRKRLRPAQSGRLGLTKEDADIALAAKVQKEIEAEKKQIQRNFMRMWRMERDEIHSKGVAARKQEKARTKRVKELEKQQIIIPDELLDPIPDPEVEWKATNQTWKAEQAKKEKAKDKTGHGVANQDENDEDIAINVDIDNQGLNLRQLSNGDSFQLQKDFVPLEEDESGITRADEMPERDEMDIQEQLIHDFDDFENFDKDEDDVQTLLHMLE